MKNQKGFSLIELLIVVVIIGIIAAIAIPNLLAARRSANEGSATSSLRTLHGAGATYQATYGSGNFAPTLARMGAANIDLVDDVLASGDKSGYAFTYETFDAVPATNPASFAAIARPNQACGITQTGTRNFGIATDGVLWTQTNINAATGACAAGDMAFAGTPVTGKSVTGTGATVMGQQ